MDRARFRRLQDLYAEARGLAADARAAFLASACADDAELLREAQEMLAAEPLPSVAALLPEAPEAGPPTGATGADQGAADRYVVERELGRGGMGTVYLVRDRTMGRELAMKVTQGPARPGSRTLGRFLEEAKITGRLEHPGIVPVYELGEDQQGRAYFTMRRVNGDTVTTVFAKARAETDGWTRTRALDVLLKLCDTMAYAHGQGVVHRDLKPANVMVGQFGEVYVMDWGVARLAEGGAPAAAADAAEALCEHKGPVAGTPHYMPPEQAAGQVERMDARSDVYAVGAMLYELLTGVAPYGDRGAHQTSTEMVQAVQAGPPTPLEQLARDAAPALVAVCAKAMARDMDQRYASMADLAQDLRAFVEQRVVLAYRTGAWVEARLWVRRNRGIAGGLLACVLALVFGVMGTIWQAQRAATHLGRFQQLAAAAQLRQLREESPLLPETPAMVPRMQDWVRRAQALLGTLPEQRQALEALRRSGRVPDAQQAQEQDRRHPRWQELVLARECANERRSLQQTKESRKLTPEEDWRHRALANAPDDRAAADLVDEIAEARTPVFDREDQLFLFQNLDNLVHDLEAFASDKGEVAAVRKRIATAQRIEQISLRDAGSQWRETIAAIAVDARYQWPALTPQAGLVPIGRDPHSGLYEFWHVGSGERPQRASDGSVRVTEDMGLVLVLLPGGSFWMGTQRGYPNRPCHDPQAQPPESLVHPIRLDPFFLSKYEMTQGQWLRATGSNPSHRKPGDPINGADKVVDLRYPVELVRWGDSNQVLEQLGLRLPTEAQWEYAARGGTTSAYWFGDDPSELARMANVADRATRGRMSLAQTPEEWDDGYAAQGPVGHWPANPFGLHEVLGNAWEWCADIYAPYFLPVRSGDGLRLAPDNGQRVIRGGGSDKPGRFARCGYRNGGEAGYRIDSLGCRPARPIARD